MPPKRGSSKKQPELDIPGTAKYPGRKDGKGLEAAHYEACRHILEAVYRKRDDGHRVAEIFCELPDRDDYADYYETIPEPECLDNVAISLSEQKYETPDRFFGQLLLVFLNAKYYNEEGSQVWEDAKLLEEQIWSDWRKYAADGILPKQPHLQKTQRQKPKKGAKATSTEPKSSTPAPAVKAEPAKTATLPPPPPPKVEVKSSPIPPPVAIPRTPSHTLYRGFSTADQQVVIALDSKLPRWKGPEMHINATVNTAGVPGSGWWGEGAPDYENSVGGPSSYSHRIKAVLKAVQTYKDQEGERICSALESVPEAINYPYLSHPGNLSLSQIIDKASRNEYRNLVAFDLDMFRLFERARRWYEEQSKEYGQILALQRVYQAITAPYPLAIPPNGALDPSKTHYSAIAAGPGKARPMHETEGPLGITASKVPTKDRLFTVEARWKGQSLRTGDYVHLINPDDASRPIVAQIFKTYVPTKGYRTHHITTCWYYRPEQTVHTADKQFFDREVFKTGHFCDHPVEDVIEKISVQFFVKYVRGRPRAGEYHPGWPSYVCHARFNDRAWLSIRIKNWASCIPEELRQSDFMSVTPFERQIDPLVFPSPFLRGITGPGFLAEPRGNANDDDEDDRSSIQTPPIRNLPQAPAAPIPQARQPAISRPAPSRSMPQAQQQLQQAPIPISTPVNNTRTFGTMYGGQQAMDQIAYKEQLPLETVKLFDRDARHSILWFSGPPLPSIPESRQPSHSLKYLSYLAQKRKRDQQDA